MSTVVRNSRGRVVFASRGARPRTVAGDAQRPPPVERDDEGNQVFYHAIVSPVPALREGPELLDPEDGVRYRVIAAPGVLTRELGWYPVGDWCSKLQLGWSQVRAMVLAGLFDAAVPKGSGVRLLRALDPERVAATAAAMRMGVTGNKPADRRIAWR